MQTVGPIMTGRVVVITQNAIGSYDGVIETSNGNKYYFVNNNALLNKETYYKFNITTGDAVNYDFKAINIDQI